MSDISFNTGSGKTIDREMLVAYLNTGTSGSPTWSPIGSRVTDSSESIEWGEDTSIDILGVQHTTLKKPTITQSFDPLNLDAGDSAIVKIWNMAVKDQDYTGLAAMDMLIVHLYAGTADTAMFAERYEACTVRPSGLGGEGGGNISMPIDVAYGGTRTVGTASISAQGVVSFSAAS